MIYPDYQFRRVHEISVSFLLERGLRRLVLDVDNTLTTNEHPIPSDGVTAWLAQLSEAGIRAVILSNNSSERVTPFAAILDLPFIANGKKPLTGGYERCRRLLKCEKSEMAVIGDQLLTDIWGGKRYGIVSILVEPIEMENIWFFQFKRGIERLMMRRAGKKTSRR